jgi:hypothetical protein
MQSPEHQIAVVRNVMIGGSPFPSQYDLYITEKRLIAVYLQSKKHVFSFLGGLIGTFIGMFIGVGNIIYEGLKPEIGLLLTVMGTFIGRLIGVWMDKAFESSNKQKYEQINELTFDDLLGRDKKNFALPYEDIEKIKFYKFGLRRDLYITSKERQKKTFRLTTAQSNQLGNTFSSINALEGKIEK